MKQSASLAINGTPCGRLVNSKETIRRLESCWPASSLEGQSSSHVATSLLIWPTSRSDEQVESMHRAVSNSAKRTGKEGF